MKRLPEKTENGSKNYGVWMNHCGQEGWARSPGSFTSKKSVTKQFD